MGQALARDADAVNNRFVAVDIADGAAAQRANGAARTFFGGVSSFDALLVLSPAWHVRGSNLGGRTDSSIYSPLDCGGDKTFFASGLVYGIVMRGKVVLGAGLEPACLSAYAPQTYVSAIPPPEQVRVERAKFAAEPWVWQVLWLIRRLGGRGRA
jgi:hypothetical protein